MSLQADKRTLNTQISRYMTLLSNLSNPPASYINDLDFLRGLIQAANEKEYRGLLQIWETVRPVDIRSARYIETGTLGDGRAAKPDVKGLIDLTERVLKARD